MVDIHYTKQQETRSEPSDLPDQYIPGTRDGRRQGVIIWKGQKKSLLEWAKKLDITRDALSKRLKRWGVCERTMGTRETRHAVRSYTRTAKKQADTDFSYYDAFIYGRSK